MMKKKNNVQLIFNIHFLLAKITLAVKQTNKTKNNINRKRQKQNRKKHHNDNKK